MESIQHRDTRVICATALLRYPPEALCLQFGLTGR
jgi:hypothetical protein